MSELIFFAHIGAFVGGVVGFYGDLSPLMIILLSFAAFGPALWIAISSKSHPGAMGAFLICLALGSGFDIALWVSLIVT